MDAVLGKMWSLVASHKTLKQSVVMIDAFFPWYKRSTALVSEPDTYIPCECTPFRK